MSISPLVLRRHLMDALRTLEALSVQSRHERHTLGKQLLALAGREAWIPMLLKELESCTNETPKRLEAVGELLMEVGEIDTLRAPLYAMVTRKNVADDVKDLIHIVLRSLGDTSDPDFFFDNMRDPDALMDRETARIFNAAEINPDALTEFLDAFDEMDEEHALEVMLSLENHIPPKQLVHFALPMLLEAPPSQAMRLWCLQVLGDSGSPLAAWGLLHRYGSSQVTFSKDEDKAQRLALKKLQVSGAFRPDQPDALSDAMNALPLWHLTIDKQEAYATLPNGSGSQALVLVNHWRSGDIGLMVIIGDDVDGFEQALVYNYLNTAELNRWFIRFHDGEERFSTPLSYFKQRAQYMERISFTNGIPLPHEFTCWRKLLNTLESSALSSTERCTEWIDVRRTHETGNLYNEPGFSDWHLSAVNIPEVQPLMHLLQDAWLDTCGILKTRTSDPNAVPALPLPVDPSPQELVAFMDEWIVVAHRTLLTCGFLHNTLRPRLAEVACLYGWTKKTTLAALAATEMANLEHPPSDGRFLNEYLRRSALFCIGDSVEQHPTLQNEFDIFLPFLQEHWETLPNLQ